ncbi:autotransporter domain-containing protein [Parvibaculum sp.]|uniref:autotransporter domain-containing protein n=1 Tax=Parvibaculum sp. TaxID=2024848 RepID=UPI0025E1EA31|nr:autotransporter domain-containing protein [Parvibaculum sp.]
MGMKSGKRAAAGRRTMRVTTWRFMRVRRKVAEPAIIRRNLTRRLLSGVGIAALLTGASLALLPAPARADTSWTGAADSDWNNPANWSNGLPVNTSGTTKIVGPVAATVDGIGVTDSGRTNIGGSTQDGSLIVQGGGTLNVGVFELFGYNGFSGTATIRGAGSGITASSNTFIGSYAGIGHIFIEDGGTLTTSYSTYMSQYNGSLGTVTVTGSGSTWNSGSTIRLGGSEGNYDATGILTVADGGLVSLNSGNSDLLVAYSAGGTGTLNIGAAESDDAVAAGTLLARGVVFGAGDGTLVFNHTDVGLDFSTNISGNGEVHQIAGTTILYGSNTWSGSTVVDGGTLRAGSATGLSNYSGYEVNGGTLDLNDFDLTATELSGTSGTVDLGSAELEVDQDSDSVFGGLIAGTGSLVKLGTGVLTLTGANTFSGGTTLGEGTLRLEDDDAIGTGALTATGGTLDYDDGIDLSNDIDLRANTNLNVTTGAATQSGNIGETGGSFGIVKTGAGTLSLTGTNSYTGGTTVSGGTLRAGSAGGLASGAYVLNGGTLDLNDFGLTASSLSGTSGTVNLGIAELEVDQDGDSIFGGIISSAGSLVKLGSGILSLTGANTYSGGTTLGEGTLRLEDDDAIGTGALTATGGTLDYDDGLDLSNDIDLRAQTTLNVTTGAATQSGNIGETGGSFGIVKSGAGTLSLTGTNSYTGTTTVSAGTLRAGSATGFASGGYVLGGGTLDLNDFDLSMSSLSGTSGTIDLGSAELEVDQDGDSVFDGLIAGAGSLVKMGSGILTLTGANTYSGGTTVSAGTLKGDTTSLAGDILNNATLAFDQVTDGIFSNVVSGTGSLEKTGVGTLTLTGANSYSGGTTVSAGTLKGDTNSLVGNIVNNAFLFFDQTSDGEFTGAISGTGGLSKTGGGELLFTDADIAAGSFSVHGTGAVIDGGAVDIDGRLDVSNYAETGETTDAELTIRGGANVTSFSGNIGEIDDFEAAVTVSGAGSTWTIGEVVDPTVFRVAGKGAASLLVEEGAKVEVIGSASVHSLNGGAASSVAIAGENSLFDVSGLLDIGGAGTGELTVSDGGSVHSGSARVGLQSPKTGTVTITGTGSEWLVDGSPFVLGGDADGVPGTGHLTLADGGLLQLDGGTGTLHAALGDGSTARINIGAAEGEDAAAAGTLDLGNIVFDDDGGGDGRLLFNHTATDYLFGAVLEGAGTISHLAGVTTFTGLSSAFTGMTSLTGGQLNVDGTLGGSMSVSNARLGGSGTVGDTTLNGDGVLSPGNSIGTLTVDGDLAFGDGSFFEVELNDGGTVAGTNNDFVDVTGGVTIDSGASVFVAAANGTDDGTTYAPDATYTLIAADNGVSGIFGAIGTSFAFLAPTLSYDENNVFLSFVSAADFEDTAVSPNQQAVATALDELGAGNEIYDALLLMTEEEARHTFDTLTGEAHASTVSAFFLGAQQVREVLTNRLAALFGGLGGVASRDIGYAPAAGDATPHAVTVWGQVFGGWGTTDATAATAALDRSSAGFLGGADREVGTASRIGIAAGYSRSTFDVNGLASSGESDNFHIAGYAGTELGEVEVKAALAYSYQMADTERTVLGSRIKGDYGAHTIQGSTEASMGFDMGDLTLTPFAGLSVVHIETESFTETGGAAALAISGTSNTTGVTTLGLRARHEWETVDLFGSLAWRHAFGDIDPVSRAAFASNPAAPFTIRGAALSEDVLALGAGVEIELGTASVLELSYEGEFGEDARDHGLKAEISFRF